MNSYTTKTGGTVTPIIVAGVQVGIRHTAGNAYSGKIAAQEAKQKPSK